MKDKVVIITGASSGIGKALAFELGARGAVVVIAARSKDTLEEIEAELKTAGTRVLAVCTDVSLEADCRNLIDITYQTFGRIDMLINNAGISMRALFEHVDLQVIRRLMDVNFLGNRVLHQICLALPFTIQGVCCGCIVYCRV